MDRKNISPCVHICRANDRGICEGCGRTREEIAEWLRYSPKQQLDVIRKAEERKRQADDEGL